MRLRATQNPLDVFELEQRPTRNLTVKVWGAISHFGVGPLVRYEETMDKFKYRRVLRDHLFQAFPFLEGAGDMEIEHPDLGPFFKFQEDNSSVHKANILEEWKEENGVLNLTWPSNSPDINIIENVWAYIEDRLHETKRTLRTPNDTWARTQEIWNNIDLNFILNLYNSLPRRMIELKQLKGGPIPYEIIYI